MKRPVAEIDTQGQDSFLDVIANMVGILIILVMVVGARAGKTIPTDLDGAKQESQAALAGLKSEVQAIEGEVRDLDQQTRQIKQQVALRNMERTQIATIVAAIEEELRTRSQQLDAEKQQDYELRRALAEAKLELENSLKQRQAATAIVPERVTVQNLPTPISKTVHGREMHFQLRDNRIVYIPLDNLLDQFQATARHKIWKLQDQDETSDIVGPIGGFRLRYHLAKVEFRPETPQERGGTVVQLVKWELLPVSAQLGETVADALAPDSEFRRVLAGFDRRHTTLTIWTYPDSFDAFRQIKSELYTMGFPTAGRPLPTGETIGGSPQGSKSASQ